MNNFEKALQFVMKWEGGFSNHPSDPGGATNKGITLRTYRDYKRNPNTTVEELINIPESDILDIYRTRYWNVCNCDSMPESLGVVVFDSAVNCGPRRASEWNTEAFGDPRKLIELRNLYYIGLTVKNPKLKVFLKGWFNRTNDLKKYIDIVEQQHGKA